MFLTNNIIIVSILGNNIFSLLQTKVNTMWFYIIWDENDIFVLGIWEKSISHSLYRKRATQKETYISKNYKSYIQIYSVLWVIFCSTALSKYLHLATAFHKFIIVQHKRWFMRELKCSLQIQQYIWDMLYSFRTMVDRSWNHRWITSELSKDQEN